jgi:hypothetical protein
VLFRYIDTSPLFSNWARFQMGSYEKLISDTVTDWWDESNISIKAVTTNEKEAKETAKTTSVEGESVKEDPEATVTPGKPYVIKNIDLSIPDFTVYDLVSIGSLLDGLPYSLNSVRFYMETDKTEKISNKRIVPAEESSNTSAPLELNKDLYYNIDINLQFAGVLTK